MIFSILAAKTSTGLHGWVVASTARAEILNPPGKEELLEMTRDVK
jgi:hypothetical protein